MAKIFLTHPPEALQNCCGGKAIAGIKALGEVRFIAEITKGRVPKGAVNAQYWTRRERLHA